MGQRKVTVKLSVAKSIAVVSLYIESKGMVKTAEKFSDAVYDFIETLADERKSYPTCKDPKRSRLGFKCVNYTKKYTVVLIETESEITICEFVASKLIWW
ncbi:MAG: hypothetical protein AABY93_08540 [Bacteroidota bacterium]